MRYFGGRSTDKLVRYHHVDRAVSELVPDAGRTHLEVGGPFHRDREGKLVEGEQLDGIYLFVDGILDEFRDHGTADPARALRPHRDPAVTPPDHLASNRSDQP